MALHEREFYKTRLDGVNLYKTYSDKYMIQKVGTDAIYSEAIDVESSTDTYIETDIPLDEHSGEPTKEDYENMLEQLGVNLDDEE